MNIIDKMISRILRNKYLYFSSIVIRVLLVILGLITTIKVFSRQNTSFNLSIINIGLSILLIGIAFITGLISSERNSKLERMLFFIVTIVGAMCISNFLYFF